MSSDASGFSTKALHSKLSREEHDTSSSVTTPIVNASTFDLPSADFLLKSGTKTPVYGRYGNLTRNQLENTLAKLEGAQETMAFSSGMAAANAVVEGLLKQGDHIVASKQMYGGNYGMFYGEWVHFGIEITMVNDGNDTNEVVAAIKPNTRLVWLETCSNPTVAVVDVRRNSAAIKAKNPDAIFTVDNTLLSPYILRPLSLGADIAMHSGTKYIGGHSDLMMGFLSASDASICGRLRHIQVTRGATPSAFDCYLAIRSLWTLEVRMERHHSNGLRVAKYLDKHPGVDRVLHPLVHPEGHPVRTLAERQNGGKHSGLISFYVKGGEPAASKCLEAFKLFHHAVSLGGVHSLAMYPPRTSHKFLSPEERAACGIDGGIIRLSVGLEDPKDLVQDLRQAIRAANGVDHVDVDVNGLKI